MSERARGEKIFLSLSLHRPKKIEGPYKSVLERCEWETLSKTASNI